MSEIIERVARALENFNLDEMSPSYEHSIRSAARAAIEAMREPSEDMVEEGAFASLDGGDIVGRRRAQECWRHMIDAALGKVNA